MQPAHPGPKNRKARSAPISLLLFGVAIFAEIAVLALLLPGSILGLGIAIIATLWFSPSSDKRWLMAAASGCAAGVGATLGFLYKPGFEVLTLPFFAILLSTAILAGLSGEALRRAWPGLQSRLRRHKAQGATENALTPHARGIARRRVLLGAAGLAGLAATGTGFIWLVRSFLPHFLPLVTFAGHHDYINSLSWSPDGTYIASGSEDNTVQIWRPE